MPHTPFNQAQQEQIIAALFRREDNKSIIQNHHVSERQLRRISNNLKTHGTFHAPSTKKMGRPTCLNKEVEEVGYPSSRLALVLIELQDLRQYVASQPLALLVDMQKYVQEKYNIKCSRASLSRRIREMGYTRGIIRRGFRSDDQQVPEISEADMLRIMGDPSPDEQMMNLPPNAKRARYAWLLDGEKPEKKTKKPRKKGPETEQQNTETTGPVDPALTQATPEQLSQTQPLSHHQHPMPSNGYSQPPMYISPYRHVTPSGGLVISGHHLDSNRNMGQHMSPEGPMTMSMPRHV